MQRIPVPDVVMSTQLNGRQEKQWVCTELRCSGETTKGSVQENAATRVKRTCLVEFLMLPTTRQKQNFSGNWINLERKEKGTGEERGWEARKAKGRRKEGREWRGREVY